MHTTLLIMSGLVGAMSYASLIWDMLVKKLSQSLATRLVLCLAFGLNLMSVVQGHGSIADEILAGVYTLLALLVLGITVFREPGTIAKKLHRIRRSFTDRDTLCMAISLAGTLLVLVTGQSAAGISFAIVADVAAYTPTIGLCWTKPEEQPWATYPIGALAAMLTLLADYAGDGLHVSAMFAVYLILLDVTLPALILIRRKYSPGQDSRR